MAKVGKNTRQFINVAWLRDDDKIYTGSALLLAMLVHSQGQSRDGDDGELVRRIMKDANL